jgi:tRNA (cmo5U34)-methyltransferase
MMAVVADGSLVPTPTGGWSDDAQVTWYLDRIGRLEARQAGERMLVDVLGPAPERILDLGCGDGRLAALVLANRPSVRQVVAVDSSAPMLERARQRFDGDGRVTVLDADLRESISPFGDFDLIMSGFAIHHVDDSRKRTLYREVSAQLRPGGMFVNLEVVASASRRWHAEFLTAIGRTEDDPEDRLASVEDQLTWMRDAGLDNADCLWRWRGFALLVGERA